MSRPTVPSPPASRHRDDPEASCSVSESGVTPSGLVPPAACGSSAALTSAYRRGLLMLPVILVCLSIAAAQSPDAPPPDPGAAGATVDPRSSIPRSGAMRPDMRPGPSLFTEVRPFTRWWWFAAVIDSNDTWSQLQWLRDRGFGGVEIAFVYPRHGDTTAARLPWLSEEWSRAVVTAKRQAERLGLGVDITFGTLWPFGDSRVDERDGTRRFSDSTSPRSMRLTWEHPVRGRVIDHLRREAFDRYALRLGAALAPAMQGAVSGLFCDSWEVETRHLWTPGLERDILDRYGYDIRPFMPDLLRPEHARRLYDYMTVVSRRVIDQFYLPFTAHARRLGGYSRAQCGGAPADLLEAFAAVDVPETEAVLFDPEFARIPVSAAVLTGKPIVSSETFTCAWGWKGWPGPGALHGDERAADLKLIADALFARGVNRIVWHGTPYWTAGDSSRFYATVHAAPGGALASVLPAFNAYLATVCSALSVGQPATDVAVLLPLEDAWMDGVLPDSLQLPWAWGAYELRQARVPDVLAGRQPFWISAPFLRTAAVSNGRVSVGPVSFSAIVADVRYLEHETLEWLRNAARDGLPVALVRDPEQPGTLPAPGYADLLHELRALPGVTRDPSSLALPPPLLRLRSPGGDPLPPAHARVHGDTLTVYFAHPQCADVRYPLTPGQSYSDSVRTRDVIVHWRGRDHHLSLRFAPYQSLLVRIPAWSDPVFVDITWVPPDPRHGTRPPMR